MKRILCLFLSAFLLFVMAGCNKNKEENKAKKVLDSNKIGYSVTDSTGATIHFDKKPERIMSMSSSVDEILVDLVDNKRIIALSHLADDPSISAVSQKAKGVKGRVRGNNIEAIIAFHPDLIILPDWIDMTFLQTLKDMKINVYVFKTPDNFTEIEEAIDHIAKLTGDEIKGGELINGIEKKLAEVHDKVKNVPQDKVQTIVAFSQMGTMGAKNSTFDDMCKKANIINLVGKTDISKYDSLTKEQIVQLDPNIFLLPSWDESGRGELKNFIEQIKNDPAYANLKAIKNNRLIVVDDKYLFSFSQYAVFAVEELAKSTYPELYQ